jgi:hypothetical protein
MLLYYLYSLDTKIVLRIIGGFCQFKTLTLYKQKIPGFIPEFNVSTYIKFYCNILTAIQGVALRNLVLQNQNFAKRKTPDAVTDEQSHQRKSATLL